MWQDRGQVPPMPDWIVRPDSAEEISKILKIANYYKIPVHIWGGGSGSQGGALPMSGGILLDMKRMCRLIEIDEVSHTITAEAGMIFQQFNLFEHFSVLKNVMDAPICVQKRDRAEVEASARKTLEKMGLGDKADAYPCQLSGGQQQRVAIARALEMNPEILFFDEPTSALDPELTRDVLKVIRDLAAERMTMVIVTHEMSFARDVADRIVFMDGGVIVEEGPAEQVINNPQHDRTKAFLNRYDD